MFFIHLCSGSGLRRWGDVLWCIEHEGALAGSNIICVAVDPLAMANVSTVDGLAHHDLVYRDDLLCPWVGRFLLNLISSGRVSARQSLRRVGVGA